MYSLYSFSLAYGESMVRVRREKEGDIGLFHRKPQSSNLIRFFFFGFEHIPCVIGERYPTLSGITSIHYICTSVWSSLVRIFGFHPKGSGSNPDTETIKVV